MGLARWQISFWQPNGGGKMLEKMSLENGPSLHQCERNWVKCSSSSSNSKTFRKSGRSNSILATGVGWWTDLWHKLIELGFKLWLQKWKKNPKNRPSSLMISILHEQFHHFHLNASQQIIWPLETPAPRMVLREASKGAMAAQEAAATCASQASCSLSNSWNQRSMEFIRVYKFTNFQISMVFSWFLPQALTLVTSYWYYLPLYHYALLPLCDSYIAISWLPFCLTFVTFQAKLIEELKVRSNADVLQAAELKLIHGREKTMQLAAVQITRMTPKRRIWSGLSLDAKKAACNSMLCSALYKYVYTYIQ